MANESSKEVQDHIIGIIRKTFEDKSLDPEHYFFKEGDFAEILGVGRSTIREAISSLIIRGYVRRVHGRGVQSIDRSIEAVSNSISDMLTRKDFEYSDVLQFRSILEVKGAGIAAKERGEENLLKMAEYIVIMNGDVSYKSYLDADFSFHKEVMKATQNKMLVALMTSYAKLVRYAIEMSTDEKYRPEVHHKYHERLFEAISVKDVEASEACMAEHLSASMKNFDELNKLASAYF